MYKYKKISEPKSILEAISIAFQKYGLNEKLKEEHLCEEWKKIVGKNIAKISIAEKIEKQILIVRVTSSVWRNELQFHKDSIMKKIFEKFGDTIKDIKFK